MDKGFSRRALSAWTDERLGLLHIKDESFRRIIAPLTEVGLYGGEGRTHPELTKRSMYPYFSYVCTGQEVAGDIPKQPSLCKSFNDTQIKETIKLRLSSLFADYLDSRDEQEAAIEQELDGLRKLSAKTFDGDRLQFCQRAIQQASTFLNDLRPYLWLREVFQNILDEAKRRNATQSQRKADILTFKDEKDNMLVTRVDSAFNINLNIIKRALMIPWASTKRGVKDMIGQHGVGLFSMFGNNAEVNI